MTRPSGARRAAARPARSTPAGPRPGVRALLLLLALLSFPAGLPAQSVTVREGNLFYRASAGAPPRQLTSSGLDDHPRLSPDGRTIAFVRGTPRDTVETALGWEEATSLWIVRTDGGGARMLVRGRSAGSPERTLASLDEPWFSPDGRRIYFLSTAWVTSAAVHVVELPSGTERFLIPGNSLEVVPAGRYAGHLLVAQHRYFLAGGSYDWVWLFTPDGREVGPVAESEEQLREFRSTYVEP